jgi:hypothetical protein
MRVHCCGTRVLKRSNSVIYYKIVLLPESVFGSWALVISLFKNKNKNYIFKSQKNMKINLDIVNDVTYKHVKF